MRFVETPIFTTSIERLLDEEQYRVFCMLFAYSKADQGDLTAAQTRVLGRLVREEFK